MYNNHMNKIFTHWKNLIKRKSFHIFLYLTLLELFTTIVLKSKIKFNIFLYLHLFYFILNICCTYVLYKKEEKYSKFITNKFLLKNKLYHFLLSIFYLLVLIFFFFQCLDFILEIGYILCMLYKFALNTCPTLIDELIDIITIPIVLFMTVISAH